MSRPIELVFTLKLYFGEKLVDELSANQMLLESSQTSKSIDYGAGLTTTTTTHTSQRRNRPHPKTFKQLQRHEQHQLQQKQLSQQTSLDKNNNNNTTDSSHDITAMAINKRLNNYWASKNKSMGGAKIQLSVS